MRVLAKILHIGEVQKFEKTDFTKITTYLQGAENNTLYNIEFHNDKKDLLKDVKTGSDVVISFNIRGNYYDLKDDKGNPTGRKGVSNTLVAYDLKTF